MRTGRRGRKKVVVPLTPKVETAPTVAERPPVIKLSVMVLITGLPALVAVAVYLNTLQNSFTYDDQTLVPKMLAVFTEKPWWSHLSSWRGLTYATFRLDGWLWGTWTPGFHLLNIIAHATASALAAYATWTLIRSARGAVVCGLLFAVHPVHVEAVASWAFRKDVLAMVFAMLAFILWVRVRPTLLRYVGTLVCLWLAFLAKEVAAVGVIPMLFLADLLLGTDGHPKWKHRLQRAALRFAPLLVFATIATYRIAGDFRQYLEEDRIRQMIQILDSYDQVLATSAACVPEVVRLLFFPGALYATHPPPVQESLMDTQAILGLGIAFAWVFVILLLLLRRAPTFAFAMTWTLLTYLPISNVIPLTNNFIAERFLYIPSFGVCLLAGIGFDRALVYFNDRSAAWPRRGLQSLVLLMIAIGGVRTYVRNQDWRDDYTLWSSDIRAGLHTYRAHLNLGRALANQGKPAKAIDHYRQALKIWPESASAWYNLGNALKAQGEHAEAIEHYREALRIEPAKVKARVMLGLAYRGQGNVDEAIRQYREALRYDPDHVEARLNLGIALRTQGNLDEAIRLYREVLREHPYNVEGHVKLGNVLTEQRRFDEAIRHYRGAIRTHHDHVKARLGLGIALWKQGNVDEAIAEFREVLRIKPNEKRARIWLDYALARRERN